ncbi:sugar phosphate isomerase/epimerase, partial [Escherichia coli]
MSAFYSFYTCFYGKRTARAVLTGMCYSAGSAMRHGSSSL